MLSFYDQSRRFGRREFLRVGALTGGALGLGGLSLPELVRAGATGLGSVVKDRAVVLLHMQGGPSQFETFDPKPDAPSGIRNVTGEIDTRLPGVQFPSTYAPRLARRMARSTRDCRACNSAPDIRSWPTSPID